MPGRGHVAQSPRPGGGRARDVHGMRHGEEADLDSLFCPRQQQERGLVPELMPELDSKGEKLALRLLRNTTP